MSWNFRVFRSVSKELGEDVATYDIREAFYADDGTVERWTASHCGPTGDTLESLINDIAWVTKAITLPVLDAGTGKEVEPAAMLADDLARIVNENPDSFPDIMQRAAGRG